jgi:hypothetical protein
MAARQSLRRTHGGGGALLLAAATALLAAGGARAQVTPTATPTSTATGTRSATVTPSRTSVNLLASGAALVVARVASDATSAVTTPLLLDVLAAGATPSSPMSVLGTVTMPVGTPGMRLTVAGTDTRWGGLSRSDDGRFVVVAGVDAAPGSAQAGTRRTVGTLAWNGTVVVNTAFNSSVNSNGLFGAGSVDGTSFWVSGAGTTAQARGVWHIFAGRDGGRNGTIVWCVA